MAALRRLAVRPRLWAPRTASVRWVSTHSGGRADASAENASHAPSRRTSTRRGSIRRHAPTTEDGSTSGGGHRLQQLSQRLASGPSLQAFLTQHSGDGGGGTVATVASAARILHPHGGPDSNTVAEAAVRPSFFIETYGCQMNVSDTEIVDSVMRTAGYDRIYESDGADVILTNTCAIRENAEAKVWNRLGYFRSVKQRLPKARQPVVGVLGCMAERLKTKLLDSDRMVDLVAGPDAYRDLPDLIDIVRGGQKAANVQLSVDETYADVTPVRSSEDQVAAYLSIMRGCNNMCSFCIVPFTRGRERSRDTLSLEDEVRALVDQGFQEVLLLGQNVNSYHDPSTPTSWDTEYVTSAGFSNMYKLRSGEGVRFAELLDRLSSLAPEVRFRFTSPHPKDFPDELLHLMRERTNICNSVHLPAQSGNTNVLQRMRRGYSREAYLELASHIRDTVPGVALSSDFISGFCDETEEEHMDTVTLMEQVKFEQAFMFAYSMRDKTHAYHRMEDNVPEDVKLRRLQQVIETFRTAAKAQNELEVGRYHVLLVEGPSKRSTPEAPSLVGRVDNNKRCIVPDVPVLPSLAGVDAVQSADAMLASPASAGKTVHLQRGDFVLVRVTQAGVATLNAQPLARTTLGEVGAMQQAYLQSL